jgi:hypothetical protein
MTKREEPRAIQGRMISAFSFMVLFRSFRKVFFPKRNERTQMQENAWEITVARAAPRTPMWNPKIKTGSRIILETAPISTESIPVFANPWAVMKLFMPRVSCTKMVPTA